MTSLISKIRRRFSRDFPKRKVVFDEAGFTVFEEQEPKIRAEWVSVKEVFAYKDDLGMYDDICIGFRFDDAGAYWWVSEEFEGYRELMGELAKQFPGIRTDWFSEVAFPAFAHNRTTLWGVPQHHAQK